MSIPQFSGMSEISQSSQFSGQLVTASLPKLLSFSQTPQGNVCLYEVTELIILLVVPPGMELNIPDIKRNDKVYKTPHGDKSGYVFYKNQTKHMETIDSLFNGQDWRKELSQALPAPIIPKDPFLLCDRNIIVKGIQMRFTLYEYSDKSLAFFTPQDITEGNDKLAKPWRSLACPSAPGGKANGYMCFKNNSQMINFLKTIVPDLPFETMYTKSQPLTAAAVQKQRDPQFLETKQFMYNDITFTVDFFEYSNVSIALFPTPMIAIPGLQLSSNIINPKVGPCDGYIVAKANKPIIDMLKNFFKFDNIESLYTMTEESLKSLPPMAQTSSAISAPSNVINSFDDIPIETLVRILSTKLSSSGSFSNKELLGDKVIIYGDIDQVEENIELYSEYKIEFTCKIGDKLLYLLKI